MLQNYSISLKEATKTVSCLANNHTFLLFRSTLIYTQVSLYRLSFWREKYQKTNHYGVLSDGFSSSGVSFVNMLTGRAVSLKR